MASDWDAYSSTLHDNLERTLRTVRDQATSRHPLRVEDAKDWHTEIMKGLQVPGPKYVGRFRGEQGLQNVHVKIGQHQGVQPSEVSNAIFQFAAHLQKALALLDELIPAGNIPDTNTVPS